METEARVVREYTSCNDDNEFLKDPVTIFFPVIMNAILFRITVHSGDKILLFALIHLAGFSAWQCIMQQKGVGARAIGDLRVSSSLIILITRIN